MDPAVVGLIGVVVGAVVAAGFGAWRDHQQRAHQQRAEIRTERLSAIVAFLAADDQFFKAYQYLMGIRDVSKSESSTSTAAEEKIRAEYGLAMRQLDDAMRDFSVAESRVRLLCPSLRRLAGALSDASETAYTRRVAELPPNRDEALRAFEEAARESLGIDG